ncbi:MAG TPA: UxaA family hydrolase [Candidatus Avidesulfovibrio excrementigallinarum]|nr:UxaA family hydrolase [Candidatus Avidesulfovibrio excrementigallinarum]
MKALRIEPTDNVAVVAQDTRAGDKLSYAGGEVVALEDIALGHKIAICDIAQGELVRKYGVPIGRALAPIAAGAFVHVHNLQDITEELCRQYVADFRKGGRA